MIGHRKNLSLDIVDFVNAFLTKDKQEAATQNHNQPLGSNPLNNNELLNGSKHNN